MLSSLVDNLRDNWRQRVLSEKIILSVVGIFLLLFVFYLATYEPLVNWKNAEKKRLESRQTIQLEVTQLVQQLKSQQDSGGVVAEGLATTIDATLQKNGLSMRGFQPGQNNDARLRLSDVKYESLAEWLYEIEYNNPIAIEELSIGQGQSAGLLTVNVRVKQR